MFHMLCDVQSSQYPHETRIIVLILQRGNLRLGGSVTWPAIQKQNCYSNSLTVTLNSGLVPSYSRNLGVGLFLGNLTLCAYAFPGALNVINGSSNRAGFDFTLQQGTDLRDYHSKNGALFPSFVLLLHPLPLQVTKSFHPSSHPQFVSLFSLIRGGIAFIKGIFSS